MEQPTLFAEAPAGPHEHVMVQDTTDPALWRCACKLAMWRGSDRPPGWGKSRPQPDA